MSAEDFETLSEAVEKLAAQGFKHSLKPTRRGLECDELGVVLSPRDVEIVQTHRFEGITDPADEAVVYAVQSHPHVRPAVKGVIVDAFGLYADREADKVIAQLQRSPRRDANSQIAR